MHKYNYFKSFASLNGTHWQLCAGKSPEAYVKPKAIGLLPLETAKIERCVVVCDISIIYSVIVCLFFVVVLIMSNVSGQVEVAQGK